MGGDGGRRCHGSSEEIDWQEVPTIEHDKVTATSDDDDSPQVLSMQASLPRELGFAKYREPHVFDGAVVAAANAALARDFAVVGVSEEMNGEE